MPKAADVTRNPAANSSKVRARCASTSGGAGGRRLDYGHGCEARLERRLVVRLKPELLQPLREADGLRRLGNEPDPARPSLATEQVAHLLDDGLDCAGRDLLRKDEPERRRCVEADRHARYDYVAVGMAVRRRRNVAEREERRARDRR